MPAFSAPRWLILAPLAAGCSFTLGRDPIDDTASSGGIDVPELSGPDDVALEDLPDGVNFAITGGTYDSWKLGIAWPSTGVFDEGCTEADEVCHTLAATGGEVSFCATGEDATADCTSFPALYFHQNNLTFYLAPPSGSDCWTWGADTDYYGAAGCEITSWSNQVN
jgi:hypothetical protein